VTQPDKKYQDIRLIAVDFIRPDIERLGMSVDDFDDETDLLATGIIDSFGFLDLISEIEEKSGLSIELGDVDPDALSSLRGLVNNFLNGGLL
jgi:acyl carrier protein